jgi:hypothetical protein
MYTKNLIAYVILGVIFSFININKGFAENGVEYRAISLSDIGYSMELTLQGVNSSHTFYFPIPDAKTIIPEGSVIELKAEFSPALPKGSSLRVTVNNNPAHTFVLKGDEQELTFSIPMEKGWIKPGDKFIGITVSAHPLVEGNFRYSVSDLWVNVLPSSFVNFAFYNRLEGPLNISEFYHFLKGQKRVTIAIPGLPSAEEAASAIWVYSFLKKEMPEDSIINIVEFLSRNVESWVPYILETNLIIIGKGIEYGREIEAPNLRLIVGKQAASDGKEETKRVLLITGENDDLVQRSTRGFLEDVVRNSSFGEVLFVKKRIKLPEENGSDREKQKFSLKELGFLPFQAEGIGKKRVDIAFSLGLYPRLPKNVSFTVFGEHTPVDSKEARGFLNIYLNGFLAESLELHDGKIDGLYMTLPSYLLGRENTLGIEFSYLPINRDGRKSLGDFRGTVYDTSYIQVSGNDESEALFEYLPWILTNPGFQVYFRSPPTFEDIKTAGELLYLVWQTQSGKEVYPQVITGELPREGSLIAVLSPADLDALGLLPPLLPFGNLKIIDYRTEKIIWGLEDKVPLGIIEVFEDNDRNILLGTYIGEDGKNRLIGFLDYLGKENRFLGLRGNVALGDGMGNMYAFQEKEFKVEYPTQTFGAELWQRYRLKAFIVSWLLLVVFTLYIYFRFQRRAEG